MSTRPATTLRPAAATAAALAPTAMDCDQYAAHTTSVVFTDGAGKVRTVTDADLTAPAGIVADGTYPRAVHMLSCTVHDTLDYHIGTLTIDGDDASWDCADDCNGVHTAHVHETN